MAEINARTLVNLGSPYGRTNFIKICTFQNTVANGEELYQTMVDAIPILGDYGKKDNDSSGNFLKAYKKFEEAVNKEFSNITPAFDKSSTPIDTFYLPMPNTIEENYMQSFESSSFNIDNVLMKAGLGKASGAVNQSNSAMGGMMDDVIDMTKHLGARGNATIDPNLINVYIGSKPRSFTYNVDFMPQTKEEVMNILNILTKLYKKSLGVKSNVQVGPLKLGIIKSAFAFTIDYYMITKEGEYKQNPYLTGMLNTSLGSSGFFLSDITYDMGQSGTNIQLFDVDGEITYDEATDYFSMGDSETSFKVPKVINISLTFVEYRPLYSNDWDDIIKAGISQ